MRLVSFLRTARFFYGGRVLLLTTEQGARTKPTDARSVCNLLRKNGWACDQGLQNLKPSPDGRRPFVSNNDAGANLNGTSPLRSNFFHETFDVSFQSKAADSVI
jgi:hypothetical protein